ncbi:RimJ/RimL family protein N-acetyltransferase [Pseudosporangium ferrugineum]|uniref:RimJ/RimL family protein N-acetyltransferase n=2 Tax=Pseudosporangium ferrugineum TaxID=439699 RepID=A0A2T0S3H6_9ACTN|nr:RimJ/RimL family protein N-acetyltransferase [Pseudosporangium ferrugineum]
MRPVAESDLPLFRRMTHDRELVCNNWYGFRDPTGPERRFAKDGYLGADDSRVMVQADDETAGLLSWTAGESGPGGRYWEIGILLLPEWRGRGIGWRAQAMLCDYLFANTTVQRIQAGTQPENIAEQKSLTKAGFTFEGAIRACEFRAAQWRDVLLYSRLRTDPAVAW